VHTASLALLSSHTAAFTVISGCAIRMGELEVDMSEASKGALELLEQFRAERDELDILIRGLERKLGVLPSDTAQAPANATPMKANPRATVSSGSIPVGFFHNLSQPNAAEKLLRLNPGHPLKTGEILDAFRRSGMHVNPKNASTILYTTLKRNPRFERVAGQAWGLTEWYPRKRKEQGGEQEQQELEETKTA